MAVSVPSVLAQQGGKQPDYEFFKTKVQPIFLAKREGQARCYVCHSRGTGFRLQELSPGATTWNEAQSKQNYEAAVRLVVPGDPDKSRLLVHPLSPDAGGDPYHNGGRKFKSKNEPEWRTLAEWVKTGSAPTTSSNASKLDFAFYRSNIEPILLNPRRGGGAQGAGAVGCYACHSIMITPMPLEPVKEGATAWTEEQSRRNFEAVSRLVTPGDPKNSRLLRQPLATDAGGTERHTGGKFWPNQDHPEYKVMAEWVSKSR
jgi:hypothetical protein